LPLSLVVTEPVQERLVSANLRLVARVLLVPLLLTTVLLSAVVVTLDADLVAVLVILLGACYSLFVVVRTPVLVRRSFPIGRLLRAEVTPEHLAMAVTTGVSVVPWRRYAKLRITDDVVLLRVRGPWLKGVTTQVLPRALFRPADLALLESSVPRWS
jgi:voltage-gated potassium channel Kch